MKTEIAPKQALIDDRLEFRLTGLEPGQPVTLAARVEEPPLASAATFVADEHGGLDLSQQAPVSGSYDWVDPMGLLWTLKPPGQKSLPLGSTPFSPEPVVVRLTAEQAGARAPTTIERSWLREGVERTSVDEADLCGVLFMPPGEGPFPGIMVLTGSGGGANERTSALLANHGYAALALAYFAYPGRPDYLLEIELEYFQKGLEWLAAKPQVDGRRLAVTGNSRGGELSLQLGSIFPQIKAVAAYVPSGYRWSGLNDQGSPPVPAWTYRGQGLAYLCNETQDDEPAEPDPGEPIRLAPRFLAALERTDSLEGAGLLEAATIKVERTNGAILLISGGDDAIWPSTFFSRQVMARLEEKRFAYPYKHLAYAGAGHSIQMPYIPLAPASFVHPLDGGLYALGGSPGAMAQAIEDSWQEMLAFLEANL